MNEAITMCVVFSIVFISFGFVAITAINNNERAQCHQWQEMSQEYKDFYLLGWQVDQCEKYNIAVDVPIRRL